MSEENEHHYYNRGIMEGIIIGALALGAYQIVKLGFDWAKFGIQVLKDRKEEKLTTK